jgi:flagellar biosynthesis/type III secretory pathway chaperone
MSQSDVQILAQSLEKKNQVLDQIIEQTEQQERLLKQDELDMDRLNSMLDKQGELVEELDKLDRGFEAVYDRTREELLTNRDSYKVLIEQMQKAIQDITAKVAKINAGNMRNKLLAENQFKKQRKSIGQSLSKTKVARSYYNSMNNLNHVQPQFYDSKK